VNVEQTLTAELRAVASGAEPPAPPAVGHLVRLAERQRNRTRATRAGGVALAAAAVVAAVVLGQHIGRPDTAPQPVKPSPSYYADGVPYYDHGGLYVGHRRQPGDWTFVESNGDYSVAVAADQTAEILHHGAPVLRVGGFVFEARLSFDGTKAAWIATDGPDASALVVRDLVAGRDLGRLPLVLRAQGGQGVETSLGIRNDGTVFYEVGHRAWTWHPGGGAPVRTTRMPNSVQTHPPGFDGVAAPVRLSPDHLWGAWVTDPAGGELGDVKGKPLGVTVQKPGDLASRFTLPLPTGLDLAPIAFWVTPTEITFAGPENIRCDIVARDCRALGTS
jgi:hypothetical protein